MVCKCKRATIFRKNVAEHMAHLSELWNDPEYCQALYECPKTGAQWLRDAPFSHLHGGGPIVLRKLPLKPDFSHYIRRQIDLACRCLAISQLKGDAAAEYAQFHLEEKSNSLENCQIQFQCPITELCWTMDFSFSRVPCGGMPVLTKMS
jgi:hypothetical protein